MAPEDAISPPKRLQPWQRRRRKTLFWTLILLTPLLVLVMLRIRLNASNDRALAALRAEGLPTSSKELAASYPEVPEGENAATLYLAAQKAMRLLPPDKEDRLPYMAHGPEFEPQEPFSEEIKTGLTEYMNLNTEALALLHEAARKPRSRYPIDFSKGMGLELKHLARLRELTQPLCAEGALAADTGDAPRATQAILALAALSKSLEKEPLLISQLVRLSIQGTAGNLLMRLMCRMSLPEESLTRISDAIQKMHDPNAYLMALSGEQCMGIADFQEGKDSGQYGLQLGPVGAPLRFIGFFELDMSYYLEAFKIILDGARKPFPQAFEANKVMEERLSKMPPILCIRTQMLVPSFMRAGSAFARGEAVLRQMEAALAIERYRRAKNETPEKLDTLVPEFLAAVPADPFDGAPMRYKKEEAGYVIYSVFENRVDDGGVTPPKTGKKRRQDSLDWVFRVVLPK